ncbi:transglutaminaseTgpA domain-containing protein [Actinotalea sp.]|uniref:transglutaminase family protein n=1 Tax=Actinotalea sp. TaxID=1872145 RepID=UPI0035613D1C
MVTLAVGLAVACALISLDGVLAPGRWIGLGLLVVAIVLGSASLARRDSRRAAAPVAGPAAGALVVGGLTLLAQRGTPGAPGPGLAELVDDAVSAIADGTAPVQVTAGLELAVLLGVVLLTALVALLALDLRRPGLAGVVLGVAWSVTLVFDRPPSTPLVLAGAVSLVLMFWAVRPNGAAPPPARESVPAIGLAVVVAVVALVLSPLATSLPGWAGTTLPARWGTVSGSGLLSLSTELDLRSDLGNRPDRTVLTYRTDAADLGPLRTSTLVSFDGRRWGASRSGPLQPAQDVLWPQETTLTPVETVTIEIGDLDQRTLPIPLDPRTVDAGSGWGYDQANDVVRSQGALSSGLAYTVLVAPRDLSADTLRADRPAEVEPDSPLLAVPTSHGEELNALVASVVGDASTAFDQAIALQSWFRDGRLFTYSVDVAPARSDDAVWDFLEDRTGYCVQYASAMTMMARSLGIPSRLGVGFLAGERGTDGTYRVSARRAHAWPELWFADAGWVRFEPTPGVQTGAPPSYADPAVGAPVEDPEQVPTATADPRPTREASPVAPAAPGVTTEQDGTPVAPLIAAGVALLAVGIAALLARRRRPPLTPERAWERIRSVASAHVPWTDATTPRQAADLLALALSHSETGPDRAPSGPGVDGQDPDEAVQDVRRLAAIVEGGRYAPTAPPWAAPELEALIERITTELNRAGRASSPSAPRNG